MRPLMIYLSISLEITQKKALRLGEKYKVLRQGHKVSPWKKTHQLLLFSLKGEKDWKSF